MQPTSQTKSFDVPLAYKLVADITEQTIETRLWIEEYNWLFGLLKSELNMSPTFRFPDLISACVSLIFENEDASVRIFDYLGTELVLRRPLTPRRREAMWLQQYQQLLTVQQSPANLHPNPKFQLDQLTTACVALCQRADPLGTPVFQQARINMVGRMSARKRPDLRC